MPNTLAHIGINGLSTKTLIKNSDLFWIYLGCIIPDFPWIIRKIIIFLYPTINGFDLQLYSIVQASLFFSLVLSLAFALVSKNVFKTFLILSLGSLLHLLLDPLQIKWANGVHFFAPFNWELINYGLFWPESWITYFLTLLGLVFFLYNLKYIKKSAPDLIFTIKRFLIFIFILMIYLIFPITFMQSVEANDNHFVATLRNHIERTGKYIELDRKNIRFDKNTNSYWIESFNNENIELRNLDNLHSNNLSIKGKFIGKNLIEIKEYHENWAFFRDGASYTGLTLILIFWLLGMKNYFKSNT